MNACCVKAGIPDDVMWGPVKKPEPVMIGECPVCAGGMEMLFKIPQMPQCGLYEPFHANFNDRGYLDQSFLYCHGCSHGKLGVIVPPAVLYGNGYSATAASAGSSSGVNNFAAFIKGRLRIESFDCVVDIGGNDGSLLEHFPGKRKVSIDPNASGDAELIRQFIENADLGFLKGIHKLICSSHTLEHVQNPDSVFAKLQGIVNRDDYCAFQFPSLDLLVQDGRIDQIYHQHIHYYSLRSTSLLLAKYGFEIVAHEFDASHYGALMVLFRKGLGEVKGSAIDPARILRANAVFRQQALMLNSRLEDSVGVIGYGASLMLPMLKNYIPAIWKLAYVVDEDASKHGQRYINLNLEIRPIHDMAGKSVMVTAFNTKMAVRQIVAKLLAQNARDVIVPFNFL